MICCAFRSIRITGSGDPDHAGDDGAVRLALTVFNPSLSLAISRGVAGHIDQCVECSRGDFCEVAPMPRHLQIALAP